MARRGTWLWLIPSVVIVVAVALTAWTIGRRSSDTPTVDGLPASQLLFATLPRTIAVGPDTAQLPGDRAVGRGAFIFTHFDDSTPIYLVTVDGTAFRIGTMGRGSAGISLSPDGRWLARHGHDGWQVRDLLSTTAYGVADDLWVSAWSTDGRSLLWKPWTAPGQASYKVMETATGGLTDVAFTGPAGADPVVMVSDHEVAVPDYVSAMHDDSHLSFDIVDLRTGASLRRVAVDLSAQLRPGEHTVAYLIPLLFVAGNPARLWISVGTGPATQGPEASPTQLVGTIEVDFNDGRVLARHDLAPPVRDDGTLLDGAVADGAVLSRLTLDATEVILVSEGRELRVATSLSGMAMVFPAGRVF